MQKMFPSKPNSCLKKIEAKTVFHRKKNGSGKKDQFHKNNLKLSKDQFLSLGE